MICSSIQIDSFWKTEVLSKLCESSIRSIVTLPPRLGVSAAAALRAWVEVEASAAAAPISMAVPTSPTKSKRYLRTCTFTPSRRGGLGRPFSVVYTTHRAGRATVVRVIGRPPEAAGVAHPADHKLLSRAVADWLAERIISGQEAPGARLAETKLAELAGVSRSPVREALRLLASEGLVELVP